MSLNMLVAQYKTCADINSTLNLSTKQVNCNIEKCCILQLWKPVHICPFAN